MSYQSYLDTIELKTGKTPNEFIALAKMKGLGDSTTKTMDIVLWLKTEFELGHGHAMAMANVIKNGVKISDKHVGKTGPHGDVSNTLRLDGIKNR